MHDIHTLHRLSKEVLDLDLAKETPESCLRSLLRFSFGFPVSGSYPHTDDMWFRARPCRGVARFDSLSEVLCNKHGNPSIGRCNLPGHRVLYAASNIQTAIREVGINIGETVQVTAIRPLSGSRFAYTILGAYQELEVKGDIELLPHAVEALRRHKKFSLKTYKQALFIDTLLSKLYRNKTDEQYLLTASLSDYYLKRMSGGVRYPSVKDYTGFNLAITEETFESEFEVVMSSVYTIDDVLPNGEMLHTEKCFADDFSPDGKMIWDQRPKRRIVNHPYLWEVPRTPGWRAQNITDGAGATTALARPAAQP